MKTLVLWTVLAALLFPLSSSATHRMMVAGKVIEPTDRGIYEEHGANCPYRHFHGTLDGVADPAPDGCGHGKVESIPHGDGDGESVPTTTDKPNIFQRAWRSVSDWWNKSGSETAKNVVDVAAESNGIPPPFQTAELVDQVKDAAPSIKENADKANEYFDTYEDAPDRDRYTLENENPEQNAPAPGLYRWFWGLFE
jgi:hypothetical protein